jgi:hypothetical protein
MDFGRATLHGFFFQATADCKNVADDPDPFPSKSNDPSWVSADPGIAFERCEHSCRYVCASGAEGSIGVLLPVRRFAGAWGMRQDVRFATVRFAVVGNVLRETAAEAIG